MWVALELCSRFDDCYNHACSIFFVVRKADSDIKREKKFSTKKYVCFQLFWSNEIEYEFQKNQNSKRVLDTCLWIFENLKYFEWRNNEKQTLFLIFADFECEKFVFVKCIVDENFFRVFSNDFSKRIFYYFFKNISFEQRSAFRAISTILHQLFKFHFQLIRHALFKYKKKSATLFTTFSELWFIFIAAVIDSIAENIICVLDALNECNDEKQSKLLERLKNFCFDSRTLFFTFRLKFLIINRPYFKIRLKFDKVLKAFTISN